MRSGRARKGSKRVLCEFGQSAEPRLPRRVAAAAMFRAHDDQSAYATYGLRFASPCSDVLRRRRLEAVERAAELKSAWAGPRGRVTMPSRRVGLVGEARKRNRAEPRGSVDKARRL